VAEVASIGGMVKQYQVIVDPQKLAAYAVTTEQVTEALKRANQETGGSSVKWPAPNIRFVPAAISRRSTTSVRFRCAPMEAFP
jgi:multidrug efflux pump subunit AcrB